MPLLLIVKLVISFVPKSIKPIFSSVGIPFQSHITVSNTKFVSVLLSKLGSDSKDESSLKFDNCSQGNLNPFVYHHSRNIHNEHSDQSYNKMEGDLEDVLLHSGCG